MGWIVGNLITIILLVILCMVIVIGVRILLHQWRPFLPREEEKVDTKTTTVTTTGTPATEATTKTVVKKTTWLHYARTKWVKLALGIVGILLLMLVFTSWPWLHSSIWRTGAQPVAYTTLRTGKSVGGPLLWNDSESVQNIQLRNRFQQEHVVGGICFAGFVLPGASVTFKFSDYQGSKGSYRAFATDFAASGGKVDASALTTLAVSEHHQNCVARELTDLPNPKIRFQELRINNATPQEGGAPNEIYVQCEGSGSPDYIRIDREEPRGVFQYIVSVGVNETSFTLPPGNWTRLIVGYVNHPDYQASWEGAPKPFPPEGDKLGRFALQLEVNGEKKVLNRTYLFQPQDMTNPEVTIRMVLPQDMPRNKKEVSGLKPAKVIVLIETM